jgi:hypothetical protein
LSYRPRSESSRSEHSRAPPSSREQSALPIALPPDDPFNAAVRLSHWRVAWRKQISRTRPPTSSKQSPGVTSHSSAHARSPAIRQCWLYDRSGGLTGDHPAPCAVIRTCPSRQARYVVDLD